MENLTRIGGNPLSGMPLNRMAHLRSDDTWLATRLADSSTRFVVIWKQMVMTRLGSVPRIETYSRKALDCLLDETVYPSLLGAEQTENGTGAAYFAVDLSHLESDDLPKQTRRAELMELRSLVQIVPASDAAIVAYARGLTYWHLRHRFCGTCGTRTIPKEAGHQRICSNVDCTDQSTKLRSVQFPRTDSAVIVLVHTDNYCLLCRQSRWPQGMHSTLAGFLEPGESLEECVKREIFEESGIRVGDVRYHSSQPWPFPGTVMVGFMAKALTREIAVDETELEYAHWYERGDLIGKPDTDEFHLPPDYSISRRLIEDWLIGNIPP